MKTIFAAAALALGFSAMSGAALAGSMFDPNSAWGWDGLYLKGYFGQVQPGEATFSGVPETYDSGSLIGGAVGAASGIENLSVELDVMSGVAERTGAPGTPLRATTLMLNGVYSLPLADRFSLYGGAGLGIMHVTITGAAGTGFGGQVFGGAAFQLTDNVSLFAEGRMQSTLGNVTLDDGVSPFPVSFTRAAILAGIKLGL
jgi:opacity protein-like surface antigen